MHNYAGNPQNWPVAVSLPDDGVDVPSFTTLNTGPEGALDRNAFNLAHGMLGLLLSLQPPQTWALDSGGPFTAAWNDSPIGTGESAQMWLMADRETSPLAIKLYYTPGNDGTSPPTFTQLGGSGATINLGTGQFPYSIAVDSSGNVYVSAAIPGTPGTVGVFEIAAGGTSYTSLGSDSVNNPTDHQMVFVPGQTKLPVAVGSSSSGDAFLGYVSGATYVNTQAITGTVESWILTVGTAAGTVAAAIQRAANATPVVWTTTNGGLTWTSTSLPIGTTDVPTDLTYNPILNLWCLTVNVAGGGTTAVYTGFPLGAWTLQTTLANALLYSLASCGPFFFALREITATVRQNEFQLCASMNGASWDPSPSFLPPAVTGSPIPWLAQIFASPKQLLGLVTGGLSTASYRFSAVAGLGDQPLT